MPYLIDIDNHPILVLEQLAEDDYRDPVIDLLCVMYREAATGCEILVASKAGAPAA